MNTAPTALIVDGERKKGHRAALALEEGGYETEIRRRAPPATAFERTEETPDCIVTEVRLPNRDGIEFVADVRSIRPSIPIVVYTGHGNEVVASRAITAGVDEYVPKSDGPSELVDAVDRTLRTEDVSPAIEDDTSPDDERLAWKLRQYRTIVEEVADMIYALDAKGRVTFANRQFASVFGYPRDEIDDVHASEFLSEEAYETALQLIRTLLESDETNRGTYEFTVSRPNGDPRTFENNVSLLFEDGEFRGTVGVLREITERKRQERRLERQNERLESFASIVSHDLRNPLNVIEGTVELLRTTEDLSHLEEVEACTDRMSSMLTDLLALAKEGRDVSDVDTVSLERIAIDAWGHVETENGTLSLDSELATIDADPERLEHLFENLYRNAIEHGRTISADGSGDSPLRTVEDRTVTVTVERLADGFAVADDGPGIDPEDADRIFERRYTTADTGTGFGLSIVERIVEAHGWSIDLDSDHDGARFVITTEPSS